MKPLKIILTVFKVILFCIVFGFVNQILLHIDPLLHTDIAMQQMTSDPYSYTILNTYFKIRDNMWIVYLLSACGLFASEIKLLFSYFVQKYKAKTEETDSIEGNE